MASPGSLPFLPFLRHARTPSGRDAPLVRPGAGPGLRAAFAALALAVLAGMSFLVASPALAQPTVSSVHMDGTDITINFSGGTLNDSIKPASTAFAAKVNGNVAALQTSVDITAIGGTLVNQVIIKLTARAAKEDTVTVSYTLPSTNPLQDTNGNQVASFTDQQITNQTGQGPTYQSATVTGTTLTMTFSERLDATKVPAKSAFTVTVGENAGTVSTVAIANKNVILTLSSAVTGTDTVKVRYARPLDGTNMLQAHTGSFKNVVASFADKTVTNNTPPVFSSAAVDGNLLTITFDENLATGSVPASSAFEVEATATDSTVRTLNGTGTVTIDDAAVKVTLDAVVTGTETLTVDYTKPSSNPLEDADGNDLASFSNKTATNNSVPPTVSSAAVDGYQLTVTFNENLATGSVPASSAFEVEATATDSTVRTLNGTGTVTIDDAAVKVTLDAVVAGTETLTVDYTKPSSNPLEDPNGNEVAAFSNKTATNSSVPPTVSSASVNGDVLTVTFSEKTPLPPNAAAHAFTVSAGGNAYASDGIAAHHSSRLAAEFFLDVAVPPGETATLSYTKPASDPLTDDAGNEMASFSGQSVTNNTPANAAPVIYSAAVNGATLAVKFNASLKCAFQ